MVTNMYAKAENCVFDLVVVAIAFVISDNNNWARETGTVILLHAKRRQRQRQRRRMDTQLKLRRTCAQFCTKNPQGRRRQDKRAGESRASKAAGKLWQASVNVARRRRRRSCCSTWATFLGRLRAASRETQQSKGAGSRRQRQRQRQLLSHSNATHSGHEILLTGENVAHIQTNKRRGRTDRETHTRASKRHWNGAELCCLL